MAQGQTFIWKAALVPAMEMKEHFLLKAPSIQRGDEFFPTESKELKICKFQNICASIQSYPGELQNFSPGQLSDETESVNKLLFNTSTLFKFY